MALSSNNARRAPVPAAPVATKPKAPAATLAPPRTTKPQSVQFSPPNTAVKTAKVVAYVETEHDENDPADLLEDERTDQLTENEDSSDSDDDVPTNHAPRSATAPLVISPDAFEEDDEDEDAVQHEIETFEEIRDNPIYLKQAQKVCELLAKYGSQIYLLTTHPTTGKPIYTAYNVLPEITQQVSFTLYATENPEDAELLGVKSQGQLMVQLQRVPTAADGKNAARGPKGTAKRFPLSQFANNLRARTHKTSGETLLVYRQQR